VEVLILGASPRIILIPANGMPIDSIATLYTPAGFPQPAGVARDSFYNLKMKSNEITMPQYITEFSNNSMDLLENS
jgi:hypothetical protein